MVTCKQWLAAGFTEKGPDGATRPVHVPIGSLSDTHHDGCYRVYNLWREAKRHHYVVAAPLPALSPSWETIQAQAITLGGTKPPANSGDATGTPEPNGGASGDDGESTPDPEETAPPPRRPKSPASNNAASGEASDAGVPTVTTTTSSCALSAGSSRQPSAFGASVAFAIALILRRRRRASTSSGRRA
jgi:hypothetical protein